MQRTWNSTLGSPESLGMLNFRLGSRVSDMFKFSASENQILQSSDPYKNSDAVFSDINYLVRFASITLGKYCVLRLIHKAQSNRTILMNGNHLFTNLLNI